MHTHFTSKKQYLPVFVFIIRYIEFRINLAICYPTFFRVAVRALIPTPSCLLMTTKYQYTEIPSKNANWLQRIGTKIAISRLLEVGLR
jgi:hypothetical protein